jgi:hypothetical protein
MIAVMIQFETRSPIAGEAARARSLRPGSGHALRNLVLLVLLAAALAGCGRKGAPQPPPGVPNTYPRAYPSE